MAIYTTAAATFPNSQDGNRTVTDTWDGTSATIVPAWSVFPGAPGKVGYAGLQFEVPLTTDSEGRALDPNGISEFTLTLSQAAVPTAAGTLVVFMVPEAAPLPYSNDLIPGDRNEIRLATVGYAAGDTHSITIDANLPEPNPNGDLGSPGMNPYIRSSSWNGIISLTLLWVSSVAVAWTADDGAGTGDEPSISTTETQFHTGFISGPAFGRRARSRHCPRTGLPVASDELVRDGYSEGLMVSQSAWDPEDPEDRYVPSPLEGVVDDEAQ